MSVATSNAFALLDDEGTVDVSALVARIPVAQKAVAKPVEEAKPVARPTTRDAPRGGARGGFGGRGPRAPREEGASFDAESAPALRSGGRGFGGRGGRGGRGRHADGERPARREYDRHDGSGRGHETEKRSGGGRGNWGAEVEAVGDESVAAERPPPPEPTAEEKEAAEAARLEREAEERQLTLPAYEAQQAAKRASLNASRGPAFVVDKDQFKGMKSFEKVVEDIGLDLTNVKVIGANKGGRDKELKTKEVVKDVGFRIASDEPRGPAPGGRGGRGGRFEGGRGGRGGRFEGGRGGRGPAPAPRPQAGAPINVEDTAAFPSLA